MNVLAFDIPEDHEARVAWLEEQLTDIRLPQLVAELATVHQPDVQLSLSDALGNDLDRVLATGLSALSPRQLTTLLTHPTTLFELQQCVLTDGSDYWLHHAPASSEAKRIIDSSRPTIPASASVTSQLPTQPSKPAQDSTPWFRNPLVVSVATAAVVLAAVFLPEQFESPAGPQVAGWGWDRPGALDESLLADQYMARLAESADDWFTKRPESAIGVAKRIAEFRQGCSTLILASHRPLTDEDREWLVDKCRAWASKLDAHLASVEAGEDIQAVRNATDETITKLREALRKRSEEISAHMA